MVKRAFAAAATGMALLVAGCSSTPTEQTQAGIPLPAGDYSGSGPGTLVSAETINNLSVALRNDVSLAARITYISTSGINDSHSLVSATVFVPNAKPPEGGWKIIAVGHPATGVQSDCAPSASPSLLGMADKIKVLIDSGFMVTMTDYQGLGLRDSDHQKAGQEIGPYNNYHPFLDSTTEGYNLIDSVRAARKLVPTASPDFAAWGMGQGGQAAWAANELATDYRGDLNLVGAVAVDPTAALDWLADAAANGTLTRDQLLLFQQYLVGLKNAYYDLNIDAYRRGVAFDNWDVLSACWGPDAQKRTAIADQLTPDDLRPATPEATEALRNYLAKTTLPQAPGFAPMLVIPEGPDGLIPGQFTQDAITRACGMGDVIQIGTPIGDDLRPVLDWIGNRMAGGPVQNDCPAAQTDG